MEASVVECSLKFKTKGFKLCLKTDPDYGFHESIVSFYIFLSSAN